MPRIRSNTIMIDRLFLDPLTKKGYYFEIPSARVVELVDTRDLKSLGLLSVPVRVRSRAVLGEASLLWNASSFDLRRLASFSKLARAPHAKI